MRAHFLGLDSFEVRSGIKWKNNDRLSEEIVLTSRECLTQVRPLGPCVPVPVLIGVGTPTAVCASCDESLCLGNSSNIRTTPTAALHGLVVDWLQLPQCSRPSSYFLNCASSIFMSNSSAQPKPPIRMGIEKFNARVSLAEGSREVWLRRYESVHRSLGLMRRNTASDA